MGINPRWYVIRSKPRKEDFLAEQLEIRHIEVFNPCVKVQPVNPRARKIKPYFPGYLFIHLDVEGQASSTMQYLPGSTGVVRFGGEDAEVPEGLISAIRRRVEEINAAGGEKMEQLKSGTAIKVEAGPFKGYEGIFDARLPGTTRVRILLRLLKNRQMVVELPAGQISPQR
jgi:transcription antitermination factor NusG